MMGSSRPKPEFNLELTSTAFGINIYQGEDGLVYSCGKAGRHRMMEDIDPLDIVTSEPTTGLRRGLA